MTVVAEADNGGRQAVELLAESISPTSRFWILRMPELTTSESAIEEIRRHDSSARIIVLTTYDTDNEIARAIKAGARAYLPHSEGQLPRREELLDCIRRVKPGRNVHTGSPGREAWLRR